MAGVGYPDELVAFLKHHPITMETASSAIAVKLNEDLSQSFQVILCSSGLEEIKTLDRSKIESFKEAVKVNIIPTLVHWEKSDHYIYTGNTDAYEIRMYDFDG